MFWFQLKTKFGYVKVEFFKQKILAVRLADNIQKKDKYYKIYPECKKDLLKYFNGQKINFAEYKVDYDNLSNFEKKVLEKTRLILYGNTKFYSQLAGETGNPKAGRAVGNALNKNPAPIIIPCHRVIRKNGNSGGFSAGVKWKKILLLLENSKLSIDKNKGNM